MKIFAVGRNYAAHIEELANERPEQPVIFSKPDTALLKNNEAFYYPDHISSDVHHEIEIVLRVCKEGKFIEESFAGNYFDKIALGVDFTARDIQSKLKSKGLPWDLAKGFNGSAPVSNFFDKEGFQLKNLNFRLEVNGQTRQEGNTSLMLFSFEYIISFLSRYFTLKTGDLIYTGTPAGVGPVQRGQRLVGYLENNKALDFEIK